MKINFLLLLFVFLALPTTAQTPSEEVTLSWLGNNLENLCDMEDLEFNYKKSHADDWRGNIFKHYTSDYIGDVTGGCNLSGLRGSTIEYDIFYSFYGDDSGELAHPNAYSNAERYLDEIDVEDRTLDFAAINSIEMSQIEDFSSNIVRQNRTVYEMRMRDRNGSTLVRFYYTDTALAARVESAIRHLMDLYGNAEPF